jgi:hypothetical protein
MNENLYQKKVARARILGHETELNIRGYTGDDLQVFTTFELDEDYDDLEYAVKTFESCLSKIDVCDDWSIIDPKTGEVLAFAQPANTDDPDDYYWEVKLGTNDIMVVETSDARYVRYDLASCTHAKEAYQRFVRLFIGQQ